MTSGTVGPGLLIVIEGIDGAGKSTQARLLYDALRAQKIEAILSREPTDSEYGLKIRALAEQGRELLRPGEEYRLFIKDRQVHVATVIEPALNAGKVVILDRYYFSTIAYQGALGIDPERIKAENEAFCPSPDLVFLIDVPIKTGIDRIENHRQEVPNLFEKAHYLEKVARIFATMDAEGIVRIDGRGTLDEIQAHIWTHVLTLLNKRFRR